MILVWPVDGTPPSPPKKGGGGTSVLMGDYVLCQRFFPSAPCLDSYGVLC